MKTARRSTKQKRAIQATLREAHRPLSPAEVHRDIVRSIPAVSLATVYRIIRNLVEENEIVAVPLPGEPDRYETKMCASLHHHHFHCDRCRRVYDVPGCGLKVDSVVPEGFLILRHEVVLYGECSSCKARGGE